MNNQDLIDSVYAICNTEPSSYVNNENFVGTYGELTYRGYQQLFKNIPTRNYNLVDLGSGKGKVLMYGALLGNYNKITGVEYLKDRNDVAKSAYKLLKKNKKNVNKINFNTGTMFQKKFFDSKTPSIYVISNLCFNEQMNDKLANYFNKYRKNKTIIFASKPLNVKHKKHSQVMCEMSWFPNSSVHRYIL